jgi:hypothetical protein
MRIVQLCTAALFLFSTVTFAADTLEQARADYAKAKASCGQRVECLNKAYAKNKANVAKIKADEKEASAKAAAARTKAVNEAVAVQKLAKEKADAEYLAALRKAEADYDAKAPK